MILLKKYIVDLHVSPTRSFTKMLIISINAPLKTIQLLSENFSNRINDVEDIPGSALR